MAKNSAEVVLLFVRALGFQCLSSGCSFVGRPFGWIDPAFILGCLLLVFGL